MIGKQLLINMSADNKNNIPKELQPAIYSGLPMDLALKILAKDKEMLDYAIRLVHCGYTTQTVGEILVFLPRNTIKSIVDAGESLLEQIK